MIYTICIYPLPSGIIIIQVTGGILSLGLTCNVLEWDFKIKQMSGGTKLYRYYRNSTYQSKTSLVVIDFMLQNLNCAYMELT